MFRLLLPLFLALLSCGFAALPIQDSANSSRTDAQAADGKGGWLDLGFNDLRILPAGEAKYAGVKFVVPPSGDENAKNCLVLGRAKKAESATLKLKDSSRDRRLYLLHAIADGPAPETHREIGKVVMRFADGTSAEHPVCVGKDVSEWTCGRSFENAARGWTEYNFNTQVSLYVSQFRTEGKKLVELEFKANGTCPWMVVAASVAEKTSLKPIRGSGEPTGTYKSPEPPPADLGRHPGKRPKNVILIVGDGMGHGAARLTSYYKYGREDAVYFQQLPVAGLCTTYSANAPVTDSAAAATAFATGVKTSNGVLGMQVDEKHSRENAVKLTSVAARAHAQGRGVAIMTSERIYGATPAAFFAHAPSRGDAAAICEQAAECGYEVLVGAASAEAWFRPEAKGGKRKDGRDLIAEMGGKGYALARTPEEMAAAPKGAKVFGALVTFGDETAIGAAVKAALGRLADHPKGFFMMAECSDTDGACHGNNASATVKTVSMVEFMVKEAVEFAHARGDTLVIVTADHDTGHATVLRGAGPTGRMVIQWSETSHTKFPVPVYAYGPGAELFEGPINNTDIAKNVARLMDLAE